MPDPKEPTKKPAPSVDNKLRSEWNQFVDFVEKRGYKGNPELDKWGLGYKLFDEYVAANKGKTSLSRETLPIIRNEMVNYRKWVLDESKKPLGVGKARLSDGVDDTNFMRHVIDNEKTADPVYPGSLMTGTKFPSGYVNSFVDKKLVDTKHTPFVKVGQTIR